jgi:hypothetical protein
MVIVDAVLVFSGKLQGADAVLVTASPGPHLPQLQSATFGPAGLGYGDLFVAAVVGAMLAGHRRVQLVAAVATLALSLAWDQLFVTYNMLPATIPPVVALIAVHGWRRRDQWLLRPALAAFRLRRAYERRGVVAAPRAEAWQRPAVVTSGTD